MTQIAVATDETQTPGWFHHGSKILELLDQHQPKVCVELGVWMGKSAIPVARSIRRWGGTLTCVDTWTGNVDGQPMLSSPWMLANCARNLMEAGVNASVRLIPARTVEAAGQWSGLIDYLYIDADHSYEGCSLDLFTWVPFVRKGGLIVGDDYGHTLFPGVKQAWDEYCALKGITLQRFQSDPPDADGIQLVYATV
jgi:predicted O-methyltransferase YrrM